MSSRARPVPKSFLKVPMSSSFCLCFFPPQLCRCRCKVNGQLTIVQTFLKDLCDRDVVIICNMCRCLRLAHEIVKKDFGTDMLNRTMLSLLWYDE
uniref:Uncharacterized protein n=2 Tax=Rhipicephalus TaxID=426455 RepID=A0A131YGC7_RHIAP